MPLNHCRRVRNEITSLNEHHQPSNDGKQCKKCDGIMAFMFDFCIKLKNVKNLLIGPHRASRFRDVLHVDDDLFSKSVTFCLSTSAKRRNLPWHIFWKFPVFPIRLFYSQSHNAHKNRWMEINFNFEPCSTTNTVNMLCHKNEQCLKVFFPW